MRVLVFAVACVEAYPFRANLDIFGVLGATDIPEFAGVMLAAVIVTFWSKQVHDLATILKAVAKKRMEPQPLVEVSNGF